MSNFRTIRTSEPEFERDHLRLVTVKSPALKGRGDLSLFVPPGSESLTDLPLVILLHGVYGGHWSWSMVGGAHLTASRLIEEKLIRPMVLAMPSDGLWGDGSGYLAHQAIDYEKWIIEDVVGCVTEVLPCVSPQAKLFIGGLSMGGYGALRIGAKYAAHISGISGHSSITHPRLLAYFVEEPLSAYGDIERDDLDILFWLQQNRAILPPLRFDCGTDDPLIEENRKLHQALTELAIPHQYFEFAGDHSWPYWREHVADSLIFFSEHCA